MKEYKILHLGEWGSIDMEGTTEKVKGGFNTWSKKMSQQEYGFNRKVKNRDNFLGLKDLEIQFTDLSKDGWVLDSINLVERNEITDKPKSLSDIPDYEMKNYIAIFHRDK